MAWTPIQQRLIDDARRFFIGHTEAVGALMIPGSRPAFIKSGIDGGPWGGTHRGGVPRMSGWAFTRGGPSQGNIATHVEGHAVAIMWQRGIRDAVLLVDRPMCEVCGRNLPSTLLWARTFSSFRARRATLTSGPRTELSIAAWDKVTLYSIPVPNPQKPSWRPCVGRATPRRITRRCFPAAIAMPRRR